MPKPQTLSDLLKLEIADHLFIRSMSQPDAKERLLALSTDDFNNKIEMFIRTAHVSKEIENLLKDKVFTSRFANYYFQICGLLNETKDTKEFLVYSLRNLSMFDQLRGIYFYYHSQLFRNTSEENVGSEMLILEHALKYSSIPVVQRYHELRYLEAANQPEFALEIIDSVISQCRPLTYIYRSYAYIMLVEALCRRAKCLEDPAEVKSCYHEALRYCELAEENWSDSSNAAYQASIGQGLKKSNSLGFAFFDYISSHVLLAMSPKLQQNMAKLAKLREQAAQRESLGLDQSKKAEEKSLAPTP